MNLRPHVKKAVEDIMDVFTGADGGGSFVDFRILLEDLDKQAANGDYAAEQLITVVLRFHKLLQVPKNKCFQTK